MVHMLKKVWRCEHSRNECGTDTWSVMPCRCNNCQRWLLESHRQQADDIGYLESKIEEYAGAFDERLKRITALESELPRLQGAEPIVTNEKVLGWSVMIADGACAIHDPSGALAHRSANHQSTAVHLVMALDELRKVLLA